MGLGATLPGEPSGYLNDSSAAVRHRGSSRDRTNYIFVDNIRFISMAAVVAMHSTLGFGSLIGVDSNLSVALIQPFKFGTIGFFLISGFLMGDGLTRRSPTEYMKRRLNTVFAPWSVWFTLFFGLLLINGTLNSWSLSHTPHALLRLAGARFLQALFGSAFWFVPNLLLSVGILLLCRRFLFDLRLGWAFLACSSFYSLNLYYGWLPMKSHTEALLGFVFYLWLGAWAARNFSHVETAVNRISSPCMIAAVIVTGIMAAKESFLLFENGSQDSLDTLRISNQLYSVAVVILVFKLHRSIAPLNIHVRATTFGVYLTHAIILACLLGGSKRIGLFHRIARRDWSGAASIAVILIASFLITYSLSLLATQFLLKRPRLSWTVGGDALRLPPPHPAAKAALQSSLRGAHQSQA
jgi:hypothetical protein